MRYFLLEKQKAEVTQMNLSRFKEFACDLSQMVWQKTFDFSKASCCQTYPFMRLASHPPFYYVQKHGPGGGGGEEERETSLLPHQSQTT